MHFWRHCRTVMIVVRVLSVWVFSFNCNWFAVAGADVTWRWYRKINSVKDLNHNLCVNFRTALVFWFHVYEFTRASRTLNARRLLWFYIIIGSISSNLPFLCCILYCFPVKCIIHHFILVFAIQKRCGECVIRTHIKWFRAWIRGWWALDGRERAQHNTHGHSMRPHMLTAYSSLES